MSGEWSRFSDLEEYSEIPLRTRSHVWGCMDACVACSCQPQHMSLSASQLLFALILGMKLKDTAPWKKSYDQPRQRVKKQRHYFANKGPSSQSYGFPSGHVWM